MINLSLSLSFIFFNILGTPQGLVGTRGAGIGTGKRLTYGEALPALPRPVATPSNLSLMLHLSSQFHIPINFTYDYILILTSEQPWLFSSLDALPLFSFISCSLLISSAQSIYKFYFLHRNCNFNNYCLHGVRLRA